MASISLADELVIVLIFVNNEHFAKTQSLSHRGKDFACGQNANADAAWAGRNNFSKSNNSCA